MTALLAFTRGKATRLLAPCYSMLTASLQHPKPRRRLAHYSRWQAQWPGKLAEGSSLQAQASSSGMACEGATLQGSSSDGAATSSSTSAQENVGVLLLNLGGPEKLDDIQPFLYNLFADPDIIRLPTLLQFAQPAIAQLVSSLRAPKSREGYKAIGGGSPLRRITEEQAVMIHQALKQKGLSCNVYVAMRYWKPFTEDALELLKRDEITQMVVLPLYPHFSVSTSGSSLRLLEALLKADPKLRQVKHVVIPSWYKRSGYINAMADLIMAELKKFAERQEVEIFFSAHGVPQSYVDDGDPYKEEMEHCVQLIMQEVRQRGAFNHHTLAYQSRVGPVEWLRPYTDDTIRKLGHQGVRSLLAVPVSFVSEHIETLEEIDKEYRKLAEESGISNWGRVPALNTNTTFIEDLADAVLEALPYVGSLKAADSTDSVMGLELCMATGVKMAPRRQKTHWLLNVLNFAARYNRDPEL